jgi:hypothetical protein
MPRLLRFIPLLALLILCLLVFEKLAFSDMILARGDTYHYFYPYWDARNDAFRAGELPLWTPDIFMGAPLLADPQIGTFYPPNWLMTPFTPPDGIRYSILLHVFWACLGTFFLFRRLISSATLPAITAAAIFGLGGYMGAHVEQINQLQGLAWLPWLMVLLHRLLEGERRIYWLLLLAMAWALQIFSGHTQSTFLTGIAMGLYGISFQHSAVSGQQKRLKTVFSNLLLLAIAAIVAILLAIPQLLPTLELIGMSNRGSGLNANEATAFSLPPWYLGRALLPSYDGQLFGEFINYIGVIGLLLAAYGVMSSINDKRLWIWIGLAILGLFFAFGRANPIYVWLAELPFFNFFRVPARWMALYALAMAMLAGYGVSALGARIDWRRLVLPILFVLGLIGMAWYFPIDATEITGSATPTMASYAGWAIALGGFFLLLILTRYQRVATGAKVGETNSFAYYLLLPPILTIAVIVELFLASRVMPYNDLVPREVYLGQRFTISQMLAFNEGQIPPPRMLSISGRLFDVGDKDTLLARYARMGMDTEAQATAFTALKSQELLFPNLSLAWGIPSIDGYGGGLLPTIYYSQFTSLLLPEGSLRTVDGRLGEMMALEECRGACVPSWEWLMFTNTEYIIIDKVYDIWIDGVAYDTAITPHTLLSTFPPEDFEYTEFRILHRGLLPNYENSVVPFDEMLNLTSVPEREVSNSLPDLYDVDNQILAITAVDTRTGDFLQLQPRYFERVLSSDIKIYRLDERISIRAFLASIIHVLPDDWQGHEDALVSLSNDPIRTIIHGDAPPLEGAGEVNFTSYTATRIEMTVNSDAEAYLILNDAYYAGWRATVNGIETHIYRANVMFRAVQVPAGESTVVFEFVPTLWYGAIGFGAVVWVLALGVMIFLWRKASDSHRRGAENAEEKQNL